MSAGNVKKGYIDFNAECYYGSIELYNRWMTNGDMKKDDILFTLEAPLGNVALIPDDKKYILSQRTILLQLRATYNSSFVFQQLLSDVFQNRLSNKSTGSTAQGIKRRVFEKVLIPLPPTLGEQKAIAQALTDVDNLITELDRLIAKKKAIKQGAIQELLTGKRRLKGFTGEWVIKKLGDIGNTFSGLSGKSKKDFDNGNYPYITFLNVMNNIKIDTSILEYVKINKGETQNTFRKGDLFFNTSSETPEEVGMCAVLMNDVDNLHLNSFCFGYRLNDNEKVDSLLLSYLINSNTGRNLFVSLGQGATRYNLSKSNFSKVEIRIPDNLEEQKAIAQILSDMDAEIEALEIQKSKTRRIKQGMMQELLTGKTRLIKPVVKETQTKKGSIFQMII